MVEFKSKLNDKVNSDLTNWKLKRISWIIVIASLIVVLIGLLSSFSGEEGTFVGGIILIFAGICLLPFTLLLAKLAQKSYNKTMSLIGDDTEQVFRFYEDKFVLTLTKGDEFCESLETKYSLFYRVYEEKEFYVMFISRSLAYLVYKDKITEGTFGELDTIFKNSLNNKFKKLKK